MAVRNILQLGDLSLRETAVDWNFRAQAADLEDLIRDLGDARARAREETGYGRGIAAPQLGV